MLVSYRVDAPVHVYYNIVLINVSFLNYKGSYIYGLVRKIFISSFFYEQRVQILFESHFYYDLYGFFNRIV